MNILIAECSIDLIPKNWLVNDKIMKYYQKRGRYPLINSSDHQHLLQNIKKEDRNDRPDILHFGLLTALGLNKVISNLEVFFSSKHGNYKLDKKINLPRSQSRFYGLLETVLQGTYKGELITRSEQAASQDSTQKILFSKHGKHISEIKLENYKTFIFGGFSNGTFRHSYRNATKVSLGLIPFDLWTAISVFYGFYYKTLTS